MRVILDALKAARALIADRTHWTAGTAARDAEEQPVDPFNIVAVKFCAVGAVLRVTHDNRSLTHHVVDILACVANQRIEQVNDHQGHTAVLEVFDKAISACEHGQMPLLGANYGCYYNLDPMTFLAEAHKSQQLPPKLEPLQPVPVVVIEEEERELAFA